MLKLRARKGADRESRPCQYTYWGWLTTQAFRTRLNLAWAEGEDRSSWYWWHRGMSTSICSQSSGIHTLNILRILCKSQKNIFAQGMNFQDISSVTKYSKHNDKHFFSIHVYICILYNLFYWRGDHKQYSTHTCIPFIKVHLYILLCCTFSLNTNLANE